MVTGGKHFSKTFSFFYMWKSEKKQSFQPIFFIWYLSNEKTAFVDKSRAEPTIFFIEKISFSFKLFSGHLYGQSFIKTSEVLLKETSNRFIHGLHETKENPLLR